MSNSASRYAFPGMVNAPNVGIANATSNSHVISCGP